MEGSGPGGQPGLHRSLGTFELTATGIGIILGAGIYVLIGEAAGLAGNAVWVPFVGSALAAGFTGLTYAELAARYPRAAATFEYTRQAFGERIGFIAGWTVLFAAVIQVSAVGIGFAGYFSELTDLPRTPVTMSLIVVSGVVLWIGVKESVRVGVLFAAIEAGGLVLAIAVSARYVGGIDYFEFAGGFSDVMRASALLFFAFLGFEQMANLAEETREPRRSLPYAIILAVVATTVVYILVAVTSVSVVNWRDLAASDAPLGLVVRTATGAQLSKLLSVIALFATANTVLFGLMAASRQAFGMARALALPSLLARLSHSRRTPWVAIIIVCLVSGLFSLAGTIGEVAQMSNAAILIAFMLVNAALIKVGMVDRRSHAPAGAALAIRGVRIVPVFGFITSAVMLGYTGLVPILLALGLVGSGWLITVLRARWDTVTATHGHAE